MAKKDGPCSTQDRCFLGFLLFCLHSRSRFADAARVRTEPVLDLDSDGEGFIEATTVGKYVKTGQTAKRSRMSVPMVGIAGGLSGCSARSSWATAWLELRKELGLDAAKDKCLMPVPLKDGGFGSRRLSSSDGGRWLKSLAPSLGVDGEGLSRIGTHSCKVTLLSWAAKAGVPKASRRLLGAHSNRNDRSVLE